MNALAQANDLSLNSALLGESDYNHDLSLGGPPM